MGQLWPAVRASAALQAALLLLSTSEPMRLLLPFPTSWLLFPTAACLLGIWNPGFYVHSLLRVLCRPITLCTRPVLPWAMSVVTLPTAHPLTLPSGCSLGASAPRASPALLACPFESDRIVFRPFLRFVNIISNSSPGFSSPRNLPLPSERSVWALCQDPADHPAQRSMRVQGEPGGLQFPDPPVSPRLAPLSCLLLASSRQLCVHVPHSASRRWEALVQNCEKPDTLPSPSWG